MPTVSFTFLVMAYSRVLRFAWVCVSLLSTVYADGMIGMIIMGTTAILAMAILNTLFFLDAFGKFAKFMKMHHDDDCDSNDDELTMEMVTMMMAMAMLTMLLMRMILGMCALICFCFGNLSLLKGFSNLIYESLNEMLI